MDKRKIFLIGIENYHDLGWHFTSFTGNSSGEHINASGTIYVADISQNCWGMVQISQVTVLDRYPSK